MGAPRAVTLITGASSGIGAELARVFAAHGHELALTARSEADLNAVADSIAAGGHARPHVIVADLSRLDGGARIAHELVARGLEPDIVVNNAGFGLGGSADALDRGMQLAMVDLNVRALTDLSLRWTDSLARRGGGILNVASVAGFLPGPGMAVYYATKAYVVSFSQALHHELKPAGVRVTALCPGPVPTKFHARAGIGHTALTRLFNQSAEKVARDGYAGLAAGKRLVVPGLANKLLVLLSGWVPTKLFLMMGDWRRRQAGKPRPHWPRQPSSQG
jgi:uncharacterized protein